MRMYDDRDSLPRWILLLIVLLIVIPLSMGVLMMLFFQPDDHMFGFPMMSFTAFGMLLIGILPIIVILLVIWLLLREPDRRQPYSPYGPYQYPLPCQYPSSYPLTQRPQWLEELDARYARGELSRAEYMRMREDIERGGH